MNYWPEFLLVASVHLVAVASPGPDFAIVLRYAIRHGRQTAIMASLGIGLAILLHVSYSLLGIAVLLQTKPWLFQLFCVIAAAYLAYLGVGCLRSKAQPQQVGELPQSAQLPLRKAFINGFLTNGLNPKATLFFLALFTAIISANTPNLYKMLYGFYMAAATAVWFMLLSILLSRQNIRSFLLKKGYWLDRVMGLVLLALAMHLLYSMTDRV